MPQDSQCRPLQLLVFSDAGYNSLPRSSSMECYYVRLGKPIRRGGAITCAAHPIHWAARKIKRCVRSSLAAEAVALATALDNAMWFQAVYYELWNGKFLYTPFNALRPMPLITPFKVARIDDQKSTTETVYLTLQCKECRAIEKLTIEEMSEGYNSMFFQESDKDADKPVHILALTDCANAYSATFASNHRGGDKLTRLHLCFIRGGLHIYNISYLSA